MRRGERIVIRDQDGGAGAEDPVVEFANRRPRMRVDGDDVVLRRRARFLLGKRWRGGEEDERKTGGFQNSGFRKDGAARQDLSP